MARSALSSGGYLKYAGRVVAVVGILLGSRVRAFGSVGMYVDRLRLFLARGNSRLFFFGW